MKRHISLYYGSLNFRTSLFLIACSFLHIFTSGKKVNKKLKNAISDKFISPINVFTFKSARSALAVYLKAIKRDKSEIEEVIISSYTCLAVASGVLAAGMKPVYCDINLASANLNPEELSKHINKNTRAIIVQHTLGSFCPVKEIRKKIEGLDILIIEDCALSLGSINNDGFFGSSADASIFSMELSKIISTGWGGVLISRRDSLNKKLNEVYSSICEISSWQVIKDSLQTVVLGISYNRFFYNYLGKYMIYLGYKYKLFRISTPVNETNANFDEHFILKLPVIHQLLAIYQWRRLGKISILANRNFFILKQKLEILGFFIPGFFKDNRMTVTPRISFLVNDPNLSLNFFEKKNIEAGLWFNGPLSPLPSSTLYNYEKKQYPNSSLLAKHVINLPCHQRINEWDLNYMIKIIEEFAMKHPDQIYHVSI